MRDWATIGYDICRIFLGLLFLSSGIGKFYGTSGMMGPGWLFERLAPHGLLGFAQFIATAQIIIGFLLLIRRFTTAGAIMLVPMLLNILVIVLSLQWQGTPVVVSLFLVMNAYLLYHDRAKWLPLLGLDGRRTTTLAWWRDIWPYAVALLLLLGGTWSAYATQSGDKWVMRTGLVVLLGTALVRMYVRR